MRKTTRKTLEQFKEEATTLWKGRYGYDDIVEYKNNKTKMPIRCYKHGIFYMNANNHLNGQGCRECRKEHLHDLLSLTTEEFIKRAKEVHGDTYIYDETKYHNSDTDVAIMCRKHGLFYQRPFNHLKGHGCDACAHEQNANDRRLTNDEVIKQFQKTHGTKYIYNYMDYQRFGDKIKIICLEHGEFWQTPAAHISGQGCPKCKESKLETEICLFLEENNVAFERQKTFDWLKNERNLYLDFYLLDYNIAIECQGGQHFKPIEYFGGEGHLQYLSKLDSLKRKLCEEHGIKILYFSNLGIDYPYTVFEDKKELLKEIIS